MAEATAVEIELGDGSLHGTLCLPPEGRSPAKVPAVLVSRGVLVPHEDASGLFDDLSRDFTKAGLALVLYEPRCADLILEEFHAHTAAQDIDDGMAVLSWMTRHDRIDPARIGLLGYSLGAIAASALARRVEAISRVCLLAPATVASIAELLIRSNGQPSPINPELLPAAYVPSLAELDSPRDSAFHDRPTLLLHGAADRTIPPTASLQYLRALESAGRSVECALIARADHVFSSPSTRMACIESLLRFFAGMEARVAATVEAAGS